MPKRHRALIYEYLFKEGVLVAMKDTHLAKHPEIDVPNLHVMKALQVYFVLFICIGNHNNTIFVFLVFEVSCLCDWTVCLAPLLLVPYQWRYPVFEGLLAFAPWGMFVFPPLDEFEVNCDVIWLFRLSQLLWSPRGLSQLVHELLLLPDLRLQRCQRIVRLTGVLLRLVVTRRQMLELVPTPTWNS